MVRLFRKDFILNSSKKNEIVVEVPDRSINLFLPFAIISLGIVTIIFSWLFLGSLTVTVKADGIILPIGSVRGVSSKGEGVINEVYKKAGNDIKSGDIIMRIDNIESLASYNEKRRQYIEKYKIVSKKMVSSINKGRRFIKQAKIKLKHLNQSIIKQLNIKNNIARFDKDFTRFEKDVLNTKQKNYENLKSSYGEIVSTLKELKEKNLVSLEEIIKANEKFGDINTRTKENLLSQPRLKLDVEKRKLELNKLENEIISTQSEILELKGNIDNYRDEIEISLFELDEELKAVERDLLLSERRLWFGSYGYSPFSGRLSAINKFSGENIKLGENYGVLHLVAQRKGLMFTKFSDANQGYFDINFRGQISRISVDGDVENQIKQAFIKYMPNFVVTVRETEDIVVVELDRNSQLLSEVYISNVNLKDGDDIPRFVDVVSIGDNWRPDKIVNVAVIDNRYAADVKTGQSATTRPNYEDKLIGNKLVTKVSSIGEYGSTKLELKSLVGTEEIANVISSKIKDTAGTAVVVLDILYDDNGNPIWLDKNKNKKFKVGSLTYTSIEVGKIKPINAILKSITGIGE